MMGWQIEKEAVTDHALRETLTRLLGLPQGSNLFLVVNATLKTGSPTPFLLIQQASKQHLLLHPS